MFYNSAGTQRERLYGRTGTHSVNGEIEGEGIFQDIRHWFTGKYNGEADFRKWLDANKDTLITSIRIYREPVNSVILGALDAINLGKFNKQKSDLNYDKLFHLSMIINGSIRIEKNSIVKVSPFSGYADGIESIRVPEIPQGLTIGKAFLTMIEKIGDKDFFVYDAYKRNCQDFLQIFLRANGMLTPELKAFIHQNASEILKGLPFYSSFASNVITDLGSFFGAGLMTPEWHEWNRRRPGGPIMIK